MNFISISPSICLWFADYIHIDRRFEMCMINFLVTSKQNNTLRRSWKCTEKRNENSCWLVVDAETERFIYRRFASNINGTFNFFDLNCCPFGYGTSLYVTKHTINTRTHSHKIFSIENTFRSILVGCCVFSLESELYTFNAVAAGATSRAEWSVLVKRFRQNVICSSERIKLKKVTGSLHETLRTFWH